MKVKKEYINELVKLGFIDDEIECNDYWRSLGENSIYSDDDLEIEETYSYGYLHVSKVDGTIYTNIFYDGSSFVDVYVRIPDILKEMILKGMVE